MAIYIPYRRGDRRLPLQFGVPCNKLITSYILKMLNVLSCKDNPVYPLSRVGSIR